MQPLAGLKVLTVENFIAGPFASMWLADAGAEVVKIERPDGGDLARDVMPWKETAGGDRRSLGLLRANRNKKSVALDLKQARGKEIFKDLVRSADVLIENLRPDAMDKLGLSFRFLEPLNPRLIYLGISGFGHADILQSPLSDLPAFDVIGQAMSGLMFRPTGADMNPVYLGFSLSDLIAGIVGAYGVTLALIQRGITNRGQKIDVSLYDASLVLNELSVILYGVTGKRAPSGVHALSAPFGAYLAKDGHIVIAVLGEHIWKRFCSAIGREDLIADVRFADGMERGKNAAALKEIIEEWLSTRAVRDAVAVLNKANVPASQVNDAPDIFSCQHVAARKMLATIHDPAWGDVSVVGNPVKMSGAEEMPLRSPPNLGQDTEGILRGWINLGDDEIKSLRSSGVIGS